MGLSMPANNISDDPIPMDNKTVEFARRIDFGGQVLFLDGLSGTK